MVGYAVLAGAVVGSFLNVCIDRLPQGGSLITPSSHCPSCSRQLHPLELAPILSYLILRGRCRSCGASIPARVLLVEAGTAAVFALIVLRYGVTVRSLWIAIFAAFLIVMAMTDLEHKRILNVVSLPAITVSLIAVPFLAPQAMLQFLLGGVLGFALLMAIALVSRGGMGMGDVKMATAIGLATGYPEALLALFLGFVLGGLVAGCLLLAGVLKRKDPIAFGPFLALGGIITLLYGDVLLAWWLARM